MISTSKVDHCTNDNFKENTQYEVDTCPIPNSQNLAIEVSMNRSTTLHEVLNKLIAQLSHARRAQWSTMGKKMW